MNKCKCGFKSGDMVVMQSGFTKANGEPAGLVHGEVQPWHAGCGHIVFWKETGAATPLPNENVIRDVSA